MPLRSFIDIAVGRVGRRRSPPLEPVIGRRLAPTRWPIRLLQPQRRRARSRNARKVRRDVVSPPATGSGCYAAVTPGVRAMFSTHAWRASVRTTVSTWARRVCQRSSVCASLGRHPQRTGGGITFQLAARCRFCRTPDGTKPRGRYLARGDRVLGGAYGHGEFLPRSSQSAVVVGGRRNRYGNQRAASEARPGIPARSRLLGSRLDSPTPTLARTTAAGDPAAAAAATAAHG
jgi:hypothetical protein